MKRYYFHVEYGEYTPDEEGTEFASPEAARNAGLKVLVELLRNQDDAFWAKPDATVTVADETGLVLWTLTAAASASAAAAGSTSASR